MINPLIKVTKGMRVTWTGQFGKVDGIVEQVQAKGTLAASNASSRPVTGTPTDPAALVTVMSSGRPTRIQATLKASDLSLFAAADLSFDERRRLLQDSLSEMDESQNHDYYYCSSWISDVWDDFLVYTRYEDGASQKYRRTYAIADDYAITWGEPERVIITQNIETAPAEMNAAPAHRPTPPPGSGYQVAFSLASGKVSGEYVLRPGKVSEIGDYPDKAMSFSESDFDNATAIFSPVDMDVEHMDSVLDGHLGKLVRVWREGKSLMGQFAVPRWLNAIFDKNSDAPKVSLTWDRASKTITKCAWVLNPRVDDAILMAAFSAAHEPTRPIGTGTTSGRVPPGTTSGRGYPGGVAPGTTQPPPIARGNPAGSGKEKPMSKGLLGLIASAFSRAAEEVEEDGSTTTTPTSPTGGATLVQGQSLKGVVTQDEFNAFKTEIGGKLDTVLSHFTGAQNGDGGNSTTTAPGTTATTPTAPAAFNEVDAREQAHEFVDTLIADRRALPRDRKGIEAGFVASLRSDFARAAFSDGALLTPETDKFKATFLAGSPHVLTEEALEGSDADTALFAAGPKKGKDAEMAVDPKAVYSKHNTRHKSALKGGL